MSISNTSDRILKPKFLGVVAGSVFLLWLLSLWLVPKIALRVYEAPSCEAEQSSPLSYLELEECKRQKIAVYGIFGDSFGAVNALFTGLALAGVVLTLLLHSEGARRAAKPFVIPNMRRDEPDAVVSVGNPSWSAGHIRLPVSVKVPVSNASDHPALNVSLSVVFEGVSDDAKHDVDVPLTAKGGEVCAMSVNVVGDEAASFVEALSNLGVKFTIRSEYESVEGIRWYSTASYALRINDNSPQDLELLRSAIDGDHADGNLWAAQSTIHLVFSTVPKTWACGEVVIQGRTISS